MSLEEFDAVKNGFYFTWKVENFSFCSIDRVKCISSPTFLVEMLDDSEWNLELCLSELIGDRIVINLHRAANDEGPPEIPVDVQLLILKGDGSGIVSKQHNMNFQNNYVLWKPLEFSRSAIFNEQKLFLPEDTLTVRCHLSESCDRITPYVECYAYTHRYTEEYFASFPIFDFGKNQPNKRFPLNSVSKKYPAFEIALHFCDFASSVNDIAFYILMSESSIPISLKCKLFLEYEKEDACLFEGVHLYEADIEDQAWELSNFYDVPNYASLGDLTLKCLLVVSDGTYYSFIDNVVHMPAIVETSFQNQYNNPTNHFLRESLRSLYASKTLCDFTFRVGGKEFQIHKVVFGAASPVFCAMFERDMKEKENSLVTIEDIDSDTFARLVEFIYTETTEDLQWDNALKLYSAADRYLILELRQNCAKFMKSNFNVENVCQVLTLADLHQDNLLLKAAKDFVYLNSNQVFRSDVWKVFMENNVKTACETMHEMCIKFSENSVIY